MAEVGIRLAGVALDRVAMDESYRQVIVFHACAILLYDFGTKPV